MSTLTADKHNNGQTVRLSVGDTLELHLPENPTTGYLWVTTTIDNALLAEMAHDFIPPTTDAYGAGGMRILRYRALSRGHSPLELALRREWEPENPIDHFRLDVIVT
jgi:inhibitor of cysteine peptidase